ncbi:MULTISPECIES: LysE family translocator [Pseudoalteromonas]|uniref:LysE family translocator n=1 Tax=Pseudoalteromonas obscura TaxID=3048491 RepID=A0ABT7EJ38_9GAMM|nr:MULTISPECIES: LysE family translocator [Pseudoalteromonas]MBQ4836613.1 LysE family translocator [Pseudoalteromonas luteoviolacea]MDK2595041.1 LysE family translocator [Pseudoalteromonas sp. P94(2023)]
MEFSSIYVFVLACLAINLIPGPDVIYIVTNTMRGQVTSGVKAASGLGVGYVCHTVAACLGLSAVILSSALLFNIVKILGALYLGYLGVKCLISVYQGTSQLDLIHQGEHTNNIFLQGVIVSVLNPKVALFFLSFLPQFIDPHSANTAWYLLIYGLIFSSLATVCNLVYAVAGSWVFRSDRAKQYTQVLEGISGLLLIGLASKIVLDNEQ